MIRFQVVGKLRPYGFREGLRKRHIGRARKLGRFLHFEVAVGSAKQGRHGDHSRETCHCVMAQ